MDRKIDWYDRYQVVSDIDCLWYFLYRESELYLYLNYQNTGSWDNFVWIPLLLI